MDRGGGYKNVVKKNYLNSPKEGEIIWLAERFEILKN